MIDRQVVVARTLLGGLAVMAAARTVPTIREIRAWHPMPAGTRQDWRAPDRAKLSPEIDLAIARANPSPTGPPPSEPDADAATATAPLAAPVMVPPLELRGLIGGPPWRAVVRGLPGTQGDVVVQSGDRFQEVVVMRIDTRGLLAIWQDSTWLVPLRGGDR